MENSLEIHLLGSVQIHREGPIAFAYAKSQALLAYLAVTGQSHPRLHLADLLWSEMEESSALANLRQIVGDLRSQVGAHLRIERQSLALDRATPHWLDVADFEQKAGERLESQPTGQLEEAVAFYRGDFLEGLYVNDAPQFENWVTGQRERLRRLALRGLDELTRRYRQEGAQGRGQALLYTERILAIEPWQEEAHRQLMLLLALDGRRSAALAQFEVCRRALAEELDVEPGAETLALYEQIRTDSLTGDPLDQSDTALPESGAAWFPAPQTVRSQVALPAFLQEEEEEDSQERDFVAREQELQALERFLSTALEGKGRCVFVTGDAGSGKTHLIEEFARRAQRAHSDLVAVSGRCNAFSGIGDPYLPFREILESLTGDIESRWAAGRLDSTAARRLWQLLPQVYAELFTSAPDLIDLLIPSASLLQRLRTLGDPSDPWIAQAQSRLAQMAERPGTRQLTQLGVFSQFVALLQGLARRQPLLLILDDLQWIDASSASLLFHLGRQIEHSPILLVGTYREDELPLGRNGERHPLEAVVGELRRLYGNIQIDLNQTDAQKFMDALFASLPNRLDAEFKESLFQHTKGHALFAIEMLHDMQERQALVKDGDGFWVQEGTTAWHSLPERVEAVIEERIGRLPMSHQETLKVASVEGEEFTTEVVARAQAVEQQAMIRQLSSQLDRQYRLVSSQSLQQIGGRRISRYRFRHILFKQYVYERLDLVERAYLHEIVGSLLEEIYGQSAEQIACELARHFQLADLADKALLYLQVAGHRALQSGANSEAVALFEEALELLADREESESRTKTELILQTSLGNGRIAIKGFAAPEVRDPFEQAHRLCLQVNDPALTVTVLHGLFRYYYVRAELETAEQICNQIVHFTEQISDPRFITPAELTTGLTNYALGKLETASDHLTRAAASYKTQAHSYYVETFGQDPLPICLDHQALLLWLQGYPEQALAQSREVIALAGTLSNPFDEAGAFCYASALQQLLGDAESSRALAATAFRIAHAKGLINWELFAGVVGGWAAGVEGIAQMEQCLAGWQGSGSRLLVPYFSALLAERYWRAGEVEMGMEAIEQGLDMSSQTGETTYAAELYRLRGELLRTQKQPEETIVSAFEHALALASEQGAKSLELRGALSLARFRLEQGHHIEVHAQLAEIYGWFTEGFDSTDLREARQLLKEFSEQ